MKNTLIKFLVDTLIKMVAMLVDNWASRHALSERNRRKERVFKPKD